MSKNNKIVWNQRELKKLEESIQPIQFTYDTNQPFNQQVEDIANQLVEKGITPDIEGIKEFLRKENE